MLRLKKLIDRREEKMAVLIAKPSFQEEKSILLHVNVTRWWVSLGASLKTPKTHRDCSGNRHEREFSSSCWEKHSTLTFGSYFLNWSSPRPEIYTENVINI